MKIKNNGYYDYELDFPVFSGSPSRKDAMVGLVKNLMQDIRQLDESCTIFIGEIRNGEDGYTWQLALHSLDDATGSRLIRPVDDLEILRTDSTQYFEATYPKNLALGYMGRIEIRILMFADNDTGESADSRENAYARWILGAAYLNCYQTMASFLHDWNVRFIGAPTWKVQHVDKP